MARVYPPPASSGTHEKCAFSGHGHLRFSFAHAHPGRMRIVDVSAFYTPHGGGVRTYVERKLRTLPQMGHEIIAVVPGRTNNVVKRGPGALMVTVASPTLPVDRRYHYFADRSAVHDALDAWRPDFVEASSPWSSATKVGEWQGSAPRALVMHADPLSSYAYRWLGRVATTQRIDRMFEKFWRHLRALDDAFDIVVSPGASLTRRLAEGGLRKVCSVPLGVEPGIFHPAQARSDVRERLRERLRLPQDGMILIAIGRFSGEKRWPMVINAVASAARRRPVGLLLIGAGRQEEKILKEAKLSAQVAVAPPVRDRFELASLMASADGFVHGCESETFCLVASEARASGLPIIVPDRGGAFDQLEAGAGLAYRAADVLSLRDTIVRMYDQPDAFVGRARAAADVRTMDAHFADLIDRYEQITHSCPSVPLWSSAWPQFRPGPVQTEERWREVAR